jgi:hypothetical protein
MTTRINSSGPQPNVEVSTTQYRVTPRPARPFSAVLGGGANAVIEGAEAAARRLPGGPEIVAAVRSDGYRMAGPSPTGMSASSEGSATGPGGAAPGGPAGGDAGGGAGAGSLEGVLAKQTQDNLYYLGLQQRIQDETRTFQALSNVLKTQHDSVKNAIGNLRWL